MLVIAFCYFSFDDLKGSMIISFEQPASLDEEDFRFSHQDLYVANLEYDLTRHFMQITTILQKKHAPISANINNATISEMQCIAMGDKRLNQTTKKTK